MRAREVAIDSSCAGREKVEIRGFRGTTREIIYPLGTRSNQLHLGDGTLGETCSVMPMCVFLTPYFIGIQNEMRSHTVSAFSHRFRCDPNSVILYWHSWEGLEAFLSLSPMVEAIFVKGFRRPFLNKSRISLISHGMGS
jgi:hypothetical protein